MTNKKIVFLLFCVHSFTFTSQLSKIMRRAATKCQKRRNSHRTQAQQKLLAFIKQHPISHHQHDTMIDALSYDQPDSPLTSSAVDQARKLFCKTDGFNNTMQQFITHSDNPEAARRHLAILQRALELRGQETIAGFNQSKRIPFGTEHTVALATDKRLIFECPDLKGLKPDKKKSEEVRTTLIGYTQLVDAGHTCELLHTTQLSRHWKNWMQEHNITPRQSTAIRP